MSIAAVVVAAGQGSRFGGPKQFAPFDGETVAARSVRVSRSVADHVILVVPEHYDGDGEGADIVVTGGATRSASVRCGLVHCGDAEIVVVHDAARPLASAALFLAVVDAIHRGADAAIPGLPVTDTVKRVFVEDEVTLVASSVVREELVTVLTPQAFRRDALEQAHATGDEASDDASLVEARGGRVVVVEGELRNVKITRASDLEVLGALERVRP